MWGPWQYSGVPEIGAYVLLDCFDWLSYDRRTFEGIVAHITEDLQVRLVGVGEQDTWWVARRWKERKLPEHQAPRKQVRELEPTL